MHDVNGQCKLIICCPAACCMFVRKFVVVERVLFIAAEWQDCMWTCNACIVMITERACCIMHPDMFSSCSVMC